jgi:hypothetical protein
VHAEDVRYAAGLAAAQTALRANSEGTLEHSVGHTNAFAGAADTVGRVKQADIQLCGI